MDLSPLRMPIWIPVNMVLLLLLAGSISYRDVQISGQVANTILFLIAETTVFTLLPRMSRVSNSSSASPTNALLDWDLLGKISLFLLAFFSSLLAYSIYTFPEATMPNMATFLRAASEAGWWFSILSLVTALHLSLCIGKGSNITIEHRYTFNHGSHPRHGRRQL